MYICVYIYSSRDKGGLITLTLREGRVRNVGKRPNPKNPKKSQKVKNIKKHK